MQHEEYGEVIQLQGDQRQKIADWLTRNQITKQEQIKVLIVLSFEFTKAFLNTSPFGMLRAGARILSFATGRNAAHRLALSARTFFATTTPSNGPHSYEYLLQKKQMQDKPLHSQSPSPTRRALIVNLCSSIASPPHLFSVASPCTPHQCRISSETRRQMLSCSVRYYHRIHNMCRLFGSRESRFALPSTGADTRVQCTRGSRTRTS